MLPRGRYFGAALSPDKRGLYYTRQGAEGPRVFHHRMGSDPATDRPVFGDGIGPEKIVYADLSESGRHLSVHVLHGSAAEKVEVYLKDLDSDGPFVPVVDDLDADFRAVVVEDRVLIETNWQAPNRRLLVADVASPGRAGWRELIPERPDAVLESVAAAGGRLFVHYLSEVRSKLLLFDPSGAELGEVAFDAIGSVGRVSGEWASPEVFFSVTSFHDPTTHYRYDTSSGERQLWARVEVPFDADRIEVEQLWYHSKDGTRVPMFVVHRRGIALDGSHPTLLTGYGGFRSSLTPRYSSLGAAWVDVGGVFAVANLRGGGEFGETWHQAGMLASKQNVFDDFIAAAEHLVAAGYTRPERLAIRGGSNGGLLVGAAMTQRPDLFGAVICTYPLLDMLRYHRFLVARYWVPEYGSAEEPAQFAVPREYSPYHRVEDGVEYPAVLFITGDRDTRVDPLHARKMAALMQSKRPARPVLLRYHTKAGHSGGQPVSEQIEDLTETLSFLSWQLGVETSPAGGEG